MINKLQKGAEEHTRANHKSQNQQQQQIRFDVDITRPLTLEEECGTQNWFSREGTNQKGWFPARRWVGVA